MDPNGSNFNTSPSAPPSDSFYPALNMNAKEYPDDLPPPYSACAYPGAPSHGLPPGVPHGSPQVLPPGVPQGSPQVLPTGVPKGAIQVLPQVLQPVAPVSDVTTKPSEMTKSSNGPVSVVATSNHPQPVQVVLQGDFASQVPPGVCHVCKKGKIKDSATCCSWVACFFLLPFGIIPGLIAFCYACRKPKCTRCGYNHGKKK